MHLKSKSRFVQFIIRFTNIISTYFFIQARHLLLFGLPLIHVQRSTMMNLQGYPANEVQAPYQECAQSQHSTKVIQLTHELPAPLIQQTGALAHHPLVINRRVPAMPDQWLPLPRRQFDSLSPIFGLFAGSIFQDQRPLPTVAEASLVHLLQTQLQQVQVLEFPLPATVNESPLLRLNAGVVPCRIQ